MRAALLAVACAVSIPAAAQQPAATVDRLLAAVAAVPDYTLTLEKQQRTGANLSPIDTVLLKHRRTPECRYMRWLEGPHRGREVLHCADQRAGRLLAHEGGLLGFFNLEL